MSQTLAPASAGLRRPREGLLLQLPRLALLLALGTSLVTCTRYETLRQDVYEQATWSNRVDVLFIVDNSGTMEDEQEALRDNFDAFIQYIHSAAQQERTFPHITLTDAVTNYLFYTANQDRFLNFHLGVTTTELSSQTTAASLTPTSTSRSPAGPGHRHNPAWTPQALSPAASEPQDGLLVDPYPDDDSRPLYITSDDEDVPGSFAETISYVQSHVASVGIEQGLGAMRRAVCLSLEEPELYDETTRFDINVGCHDVLAAGETGANMPFLRENVPLAVVVVSDEGDFSDGQVEDYLELLDQLGMRYTFSAIAPTLPRDAADDTPACNPASSPNDSIVRYRDAAVASDGLWVPICEDFAEALEALGAMINKLLVRFKLTRVPQPDSILVFVDGVEIPRSEESGWSFRPSANAIEFHGLAVPEYDARIEIYYRAVADADVRHLPF